MDQCEICAEMDNDRDCEMCRFGNPCLGCEHYNNNCRGQCHFTGEVLDGLLTRIKGGETLGYPMEWQDYVTLQSSTRMHFIRYAEGKGFMLSFPNADGRYTFEPIDEDTVKQLIIDHYEEGAQ